MKREKYTELESKTDDHLRRAAGWLEWLIDSPWTLAILGAAAIAGVIVLVVVIGGLAG
jgi:hypothetical protein